MTPMLRSKFANSFILTLITFVFGTACLAVGFPVPSTISTPVPTVAPDHGPLILQWSDKITMLVEEFETLLGLALASKEQALDLRKAQDPIIGMDGGFSTLPYRGSFCFFSAIGTV